MCLVFTGAANLSLKEFGRATQITRFYIEDISGRQWEGLRFSVGDCEKGASFSMLGGPGAFGKRVVPASTLTFTAFPQESIRRL